MKKLDSGWYKDEQTGMEIWGFNLESPSQKYWAVIDPSTQDTLFTGYTKRDCVSYLAHM